MAEKIKLAVKPREHKKPNLLRREGTIPATIYGAGKDPESIQLDAREFSRLPAAAFTHMIELDHEGKQKTNAVIRDVQRRSTTHHVLNVEFYRVSLDKKLTISVPLKFVGVSPAVAAGGQLIENFQEVEIECLPGDIPECVEVDLAELKEIEDSIHFQNLKVSSKIEILNPPDEIVVRVVAPRTVSAEEKGEAAAATETAAPAAESTPAS